MVQNRRAFVAKRSSLFASLFFVLFWAFCYPFYSSILSETKDCPTAPSSANRIEMRPRLQNFNALRARSYLTRLPLFTRIIVLAIIALSIASLQSVWNLREWGALIPEEISITNGNLGRCPNTAFWLTKNSLNSISTLHVSVNTSECHPRDPQPSGTYSLTGAIRERTWHIDILGSVLWT